MGYEQVAEAIRGSRRRVLGLDFIVGLLGAVGGVWIGIASPGSFEDTVSLAMEAIGIVIVSAVITGAVVAVIPDHTLLRKLRLMNREPVRLLAPFVFTAALGILAAIITLVLAAVRTSRQTWARVVFSGLSGLTVAWTLASVIPALKALVEFTRLKDAAAQLPDELAPLRRASKAEDHRP